MSPRPLSIFPWAVVLARPGEAPVRGTAVARIRDGVVMFAAGDHRQFFVREELLLTAYDLALSAEGRQVLDLIRGPEGYAFEQGAKSAGPGTGKKPSAAQQAALSALLTRGAVALKDGRYTQTEHGARLERVRAALLKETP